jgi:choline-sulfatase
MARPALLLCAFIIGAAGLAASGCGGPRPQPDTSASTPAAAPARANAVVLVTIDTLRADRVGAYGWRAARTPAIDALAAHGVRADRAYATAPITLTSHASLLTGVYPPKHGARHNGMRIRADVPTFAGLLHARGFATAAFVAAFPLNRRFGLDRGFDLYSDALPRGPDGRPRNERPGRDVVDEALAWLGARPTGAPFFLWVHLFEPHAPYEADPSFGSSPATRSASDRYDDEVARADGQVGRLVDALRARAASTLFIVAGDHGEAFGEHGEIGHSVFVYDTTLRVPLVLAGAGVPAGDGGAVIAEPVSLIDVLPTVLELVGLPKADVDGVSLVPALSRPRGNGTLGERVLYAESFAPMLDFGWSPLRAMRAGDNKYIAAPKPELYDLAHDAGETRNLVTERGEVARALADRVDRVSPADLPASPPGGTAVAGGATGADAETVARLRSLGYLASSSHANKSGATAAATARPDPKDRIELASRIAEVTSGELHGPALRAALDRIVDDDPRNGHMQMRLGYVLLEANDCAAAVPHFEAAAAAAVPSADPYLGLAECALAAGNRDAARRALTAAERIEPGVPVVAANLGMIALEEGHTAEAIERLRAALASAPDLHQARFALARAYGRAGQRADAAREARELLIRLPTDAPQRAEVQRLLAAVQ